MRVEIRTRGRGAEAVDAPAPTGPQAVMEMAANNSAGRRYRSEPCVTTCLSPRLVYPGTLAGGVRLPDKTNPLGGRLPGI